VAVYVQAATATLRNNDVFSNTAESRGAGIYLENSPATLSDNRVYSTPRRQRAGGGVALVNSPATLSNNTITANDAHAGGGVELANYALDSARCSGQHHKRQYGLRLCRRLDHFRRSGRRRLYRRRITDTLASNAISQNTANAEAG